jgi:hypothetical protein
VIDCIIQASALDGIRIDDGEGWAVRGCHLYSLPQTGINIGRAANTRVTGNFVETWGTSATAATYAAIAIGDGTNTFTGSSDPSVVSGNVAFFNSSVAGGTVIYGIMYAAPSGGTANISITGNALLSNTFFTAIHAQHQSGSAASNLALSGNQCTGWAAAFTPPTSGTFTLTADGTAGSAPAWTDAAGLELSAVGSQPSLTTPVSVTTTGATALAALAVPGGDAVAGNIYKLDCFGFSTTDATSGTVTITLLWGATTLLTSTVTLAASLTNAAWAVEAVVTFVTATTANAYFKFFHGTAVAASYAANVNVPVTAAPVTVTTASAENLTIEATLSTTAHITAFDCAGSVPGRIS